MIFTNLDIITRRWLFEKGLPIHYYAEGLYNSSTCLRELAISTLKIVNTKEVVVDDTGSIILPDDFVDDVTIGFNAGGTIQPIPHKDSINSIRVHSATTGEFVPQSRRPNISQPDGLFFPFVGWTWYWNMSDWGEPTGRLFGANGSNPLGYKVIKEEGRIQLFGDGHWSGGGMVLIYISNGDSVDAMSQVDTQAFDCIQKYIIWKRSPNADNEYSPEGRMFLNAKRVLRGRLNQLTTDDVRNIIHGAYSAAIKN